MGRSADLAAGRRRPTFADPVLPPRRPHLANEMLLVRIDPSKPYISMMSIPRELWVTISPPGQAPYDRLNSAYTSGSGCWCRRSSGDRGSGQPRGRDHVRSLQACRRRDGLCLLDRRPPLFPRQRPGRRAVPGDQPPARLPEDVRRPGAAVRLIPPRDTSLVSDARDQSFLLDVKKQYGRPSAATSTSSRTSSARRSRPTRACIRPPGSSTCRDADLLLRAAVSGRSTSTPPCGPSYDTASPRQIPRACTRSCSAAPRSQGQTAAAAHAVHNHKVAASLPLSRRGPHSSRRGSLAGASPSQSSIHGFRSARARGFRRCCGAT